MANEFFENEASSVKPEEQQIEKIKVGEKEYDPETLAKLVGLGEIGAEAEEKFNTRLDRVYPEYSKSRNEVNELQAKVKELEEKAVEIAAPTGQLTAEQREEARRQLKDLAEGLFLTTEEAQAQAKTAVEDALVARDMLNQIDTLKKEAETDGKPKPNAEDLLRYMQDTGINKVGVAYKTFYEKELDAWKEKQLAGLKPAGLETHEASNAGGKEPAPVVGPKNRDELARAISQAFQSGLGKENA